MLWKELDRQWMLRKTSQKFYSKILELRKERTPKSQAISNKKDAFPTAILGLMLLINPGNAGRIDKRRAVAALQF